MKYTLTLLSSLLLYINALGQFNEEIPDEWNGVENETEHIPRHENSFTRVGDKFYLLGGRESDIVEIYDILFDTCLCFRTIDGDTDIDRSYPILCSGLTYISKIK